jgi:hypothetical protein
MTGIATVAIESNNPIFASLHARPKLRQTEAWTRAYTLVHKFLEHFHRDLALKVLRRELGDRRVVSNLEFLKGSNCVDYLGLLVGFGLSLEPEKIKDQIAVFSSQKIVRKTDRQSSTPLAPRTAEPIRPKTVQPKDPARKPTAEDTRRLPPVPGRKAAPPPAKSVRPKLLRGLPSTVQESGSEPDAVTVKILPLDPPKKSEVVPVKEPAHQQQPPKRSEATPPQVRKPPPESPMKPGPTAPPPRKSDPPNPYQKPTIQNMHAAPPIQITPSTVEESTSNAADDEQYEIEEFDSDGSAAQKPSSSPTHSMGIDNFEVTFTGPESDDSAESAVDDGSLSLTSLKSETGESSHMMIQLPSGVSGKGASKSGVKSSDDTSAVIEVVNSDSYDIEISDDFLD